MKKATGEFTQHGTQPYVGIRILLTTATAVKPEELSIAIAAVASAGIRHKGILVSG